MNNFDMMRRRLDWQGGVRQEDRMIKDKWRTLQRVLYYSYQACSVQLVQPHNTVLDLNAIDPQMSVFQEARALINPDKVKQDYDDKIISIDYKHGYKPGDVFEWKRTGSYWLIYTQEITEDAYFRGEIRRCKFKLKFKDEDGEWATWAAIRGPVETKIDSIQKNQERIDRPNLSLNILMPYNERTVNAFDRYKEFLFAGRCWKVQAPDDISMVVRTSDPYGVLEINATEDFINLETDDVRNELKNGLVIEPQDPTPNSEIKGETFIKPKISEVYWVDSQVKGEWAIDQGVPAQICPLADNQIEVTWTKATHGQFNLRWSDGARTLEKTIVVESLY